MMNQWSNEQYNMMPHMMAHNIGPGPGPGMGPPALLPTPMPPGPPGPGLVPPLAPPSYLLGEWNQAPNVVAPSVPGMGPFIGPIAPNKPDADLTNNDGHGNNENDQRNKSSRENRDVRDGRDTADRDRDRGRRPRSPHNRNTRDNRDRNDRSRSDRRERRGPPRWSDSKDDQNPGGLLGNNMMMPGNNMIQYGNMMGQQQMEMGNLAHIQNMSNMPNMPGMAHMLSGMMPSAMPNMMPNMMDQNIMMMQQMPMNLNNGHQPIYFSSGVLLPPLPQASIPERRERPPGCRTIFIGGLPYGIKEDAIKEIFERFGNIDDIKMHKQGVCHVRFNKQEMVENSFLISGYRYKTHDQVENEATTMFIDYALNREDQNEFERNKRRRDPTPPRIESYTPVAFTALTEKIKSDNEFAEAAPTLAGWLERGECNKKNANAFYSLIQASNNQIRRLYNEKMAIDEEYQSMKSALRDKFAHIIMQFEQVGKILTAAKIQRVSDHFSKQQRRNIEMWLKMTEDIENIKEEFNTMFDEDEAEDKSSKGTAILKKYEELKVEHENLQYELEGYKNETHLAKDEAERKFEKFKAHFIAQQALQNKQPGHQQVFPPLPPPSIPQGSPVPNTKTSGLSAGHPQSPTVAPSEAKLISVLTAFLLVHPFGASLDYLVSYVRSIIPSATQATVHSILQKYTDVFSRETTGVGANIESRWTFVTYDIIKKEML